MALSHSRKQYGARAITVWLCKCDCGNRKVIAAVSLLHRQTQTCATPPCPFAHAKRLRGHVAGMSAQRHVYTLYRRTAVKRGLEFAVAESDFFALIAANCHYCNAPPANVSKRERGRGTFTYNGVDRIDSKRGYVADNMRSCCWVCNRMKNVLSEQEFLRHIERIYKWTASSKQQKTGRTQSASGVRTAGVTT